MPLRLKWLACSLNRGALEALANGMVDNQYSPKRTCGFTNISFHGLRVEARYVQRYERVDEVLDPFGKKFTYPRVDFDINEFILTTKQPSIELRNPTRSVSTLLNHLAQLLEFKIGIEPVSSDLSSWVRALENDFSNLNVISASMSDILINETTSAKVTIQGSNDVRGSIKEFLKDRKPNLSKIILNGLSPNGPFECELGDDGRATLLKGDSENIVPLLRASLATLLVKG